MRPPGRTYQSPRQVRIAVAKLINGYRDGSEDIELDELKGLVWCYAQILAALKLEKDQDMEKDIKDIQRRLEAKGF